MRSATALCAIALAACSASRAGSDATADADATAPVDTGATANDSMDASDASTDVVDVRDARDAAADTAGDADAATCASGVYTDAISRCIDLGTGPRTCLSQALSSIDGLPPCDVDNDGLADDLEDAMSRSYSLAFAFNHGDGSHASGNTEDRWPDNVTDWLGTTTLYWRVDGDSSTQQTVILFPSTDNIAAAMTNYMGIDRFADDPTSMQGSDFWLCMDQPGGSYPTDALVETMNASTALANGIDVTSVVHPNNSDPSGQYVFVTSVLFYAYNLFASVDDHEGDWEGGGVMVDMDTGDVVALYTDRHDTSDNTRLMPLIGTGSVNAIDPSTETSFGDICSSSDAARAAGVRFWDYSGNRHHAIDYVAAGGHAGYAYPGNTKITGVGCFEYSIVRDTHNGGDAKFLPWRGVFVDDWAGSNPHRVTNGVHFQTVGEVTAPRTSWANYRGQWGCQIGTIANSWPGPFGNQRHCRAWIVSDAWNGTPPFQPPTDTCKEHP